MKAEQLTGTSAYTTFAKTGQEVYKGNPFYRGTEGSVEKMLLKEESAFNKHANVKLFVLRDGNNLVARFALIHDLFLHNYIQVAFFEAQKGLGNIWTVIKNEIKKQHPEAKRVVVGLNGHLNYGAGILLNRFDEVPLFGLPYNPNYYHTYFDELLCRKMVTFRFSMDAYTAWAKRYNIQRKLNGLNVRFMKKSKIKEESAIYTQLNNLAFPEHPYWAKRDIEEDLELFHPFRFLLNNENLLFAEVNNKPVGFFLWYPDFNQLVSSQRDLNVWDVLKYRLNSPIDTFRFTEIGILPEYQRSPVALALINRSLPAIEEKGYRYCEGGFIFEENKASMAFVKRILKRCYGKEPQPYRHYAVYETTL